MNTFQCKICKRTCYIFVEVEAGNLSLLTISSYADAREHSNLRDLGGRDTGLKYSLRNKTNYIDIRQ